MSTLGHERSHQPRRRAALYPPDKRFPQEAIKLAGRRVAALCALYLVRLHKTLRVTPAMAADVTDRVWSLEDLVERTSR
jgi:hypothetical protein